MNLENQARIITRHLIRKIPTQQATYLYRDAIDTLNLPATQNETVLWKFALRHPWSLGLIDAGLASSNRHNNIRKRILIMVAVLETQIEYYSYFLPKEYPRWRVIIVPFILLKTLFKSIAGKILIWMALLK